MKRYVCECALLVALLSCFSFAVIVGPVKESVPLKLTHVSVIVKVPGGTGSGTIVQRIVDGEVRTFVWTAGHVIEDLRDVNTATDADGIEKEVVSFRDATVVVKLNARDGEELYRREYAAKVLRYSSPDDGEDLALLMLRESNVFTLAAGATFLPRYASVPVGEELCHCGCLLGERGYNSFTTGVLSYIGREDRDQITVVTFPGSSGGGIHRASDGAYVGMLVSGMQQNGVPLHGINFMVPVRRMHEYAHRVGVAWALDPTVAMPTLFDSEATEEVKRLHVVPDDLDKLLLACPCKKLQILHFSAPWCPGCKRMDENVFGRQDVQDAIIDGGFVFTRINSDTDPALTRKYGVHALPSDVVLNARGEEIGRLVGYTNAADYISFLKKCSSRK